ncbi:acyl-CoA dehydrogenase family protein [Geobacillus zalihae]|uniref:acyl-CoA dehydrogenase family protein n=1 Tax=Geobacillus zalihae TaxID=213419 RepID=UPI0007643453|nr:acyl-CoA dehydrogenase family protein [Geobacillus zalihae]
MAVREFDPFIRNEREEKLARYAEALASQIAETAHVYDESGAFPFEHFDLLRQEGYLKLTVPKQYGGDEISLYETLLVQERLARGDGSTALAVGWHLLTFLNLRSVRPWKEEVFARLCTAAVKEGKMLNIISSERETGNLARGGIPSTIAKRTSGGYMISGVKSFASLAPILDHFTITAYLEDEDKVAEFLITKNENVKVIESWNTIGMRSTGSHDIELNDVFVPEEALLSRLDGSHINRFVADSRAYSLEVPAVYLGIAWAARDFILDFAVSRYSRSFGGVIADIPHIRDKIGQIEILLKSSRHTLYAIAEKWENNPEHKDRFSDEVSMAKYLICNNAIRIVELAMRIAGGHALSKSHKLERLFRDVQCGPFHPPQDDMVIHQLADSALTKVKNRKGKTT